MMRGVKRDSVIIALKISAIHDKKTHSKNLDFSSAFCIAIVLTLFRLIFFSLVDCGLVGNVDAGAHTDELRFHTGYAVHLIKE